MKRRLTCAALAVGALLTGIGLAAGQQSAVFAKAIRICLECVGIG